MINVREIKTIEDIDQLVYLGRLHLSEAYPDFPFDPKHVAQKGLYVLDTKAVAMNAWIARNNDTPIGYAVGTCNTPFFAPIQSANLQLIYVVPSFRGSFGCIRLISAYEDWCKTKDAKQVTVGVSRIQEDEAERISKLFPKMGYKWSGLNYIKELG